MCITVLKCNRLFCFRYYCTVTLMSRYQLRGKRWRCFHILYCWMMMTSHKFTSRQLFQRLLLLLLKWRAYILLCDQYGGLKSLYLLCTWSVCVTPYCKFCIWPCLMKLLIVNQTVIFNYCVCACVCACVCVCVHLRK